MDVLREDIMCMLFLIVVEMAYVLANMQHELVLVVQC